MSNEANVELKAQRLRVCHVSLAETPWSFVQSQSEKIAAHWQEAIKKNPTMFDGEVFVLQNVEIDGDTLRASAQRTRFSAYHYWRQNGFDGGVTQEMFATTVILTDDGGILLGRSVVGTLNEGLFLSPGGMLDERDIGADGRLNVAGAAARELLEETGLRPSELDREAGFVLVRKDPFLAVASVFRAPWSGDELRHRVESYLAKVDRPELDEVVIVYSEDELQSLPLTPFARLLSATYLA